MRVFLLLLITYCIISSCRKEDGLDPTKKPVDPCIQIDSQSIYWEGLQFFGEFSGVFNCTWVEGSAFMEDRTDVWEDSVISVTLDLYQGGWPKFTMVIDRLPLTKDSLRIDLNDWSRIDDCVAISVKDDIEQVENRYSLDTTFTNYAYVYSHDNSEVNGLGRISARFVVDTPQFNPLTPDTLLFWECDYIVRFR